MTSTAPGPKGSDRLFRREALDSLGTTEDLDQPPTLASPRGLRLQLALAALCLAAAVAILVAAAGG
ncbi:hypothetical protein ABMY26_32030 [Azospirillum sp. HJ39]|uniref:hypothetical protein n=1 Tax=Azospirillum sp. HJ39 TaxID=3159496 RepID=UPI003556EA10